MRQTKMNEQTTVATSINGVDIETLMGQYLERYGRHMDGEHLQSARYLVPKYREVIMAHSQIVRNIRTHFGR